MCTRLAKEAEQDVQSQDEENIDRSEVIHSLLSEKLKILNELDEEILGLCEVKDIEREIEESSEIVARILNATKKIEKYKRGQANVNKVSNQTIVSQSEDVAVITNETPSNTEQIHDNLNETSSQATSQLQGDHNVNTSSPYSNTTMSSKPKLPKLTLPKFRGQVTMWSTFWDSYESAIHTNNDISAIDKFNYLNSLLEVPALRAIQGLTFTNANYESAIQIFKDRFGRPQQIVAAHMDEILKIQACTSDKLSALRYVYDKISVHVRGLASLGISSEQYGSLLIPNIMSKIPSGVRLQIARKSTKVVWEIDELLQTIKIEIEAREASEATKATETSSHKFQKSQGSIRGYNPPTANSLVAKTKDGGNLKIQCVYLEGSHYSASCEKVTTSEARKKILGEAGRCFNCLYKGHNARDCTNQRRCRHCSGRHHQSICVRI